MSALLRALSVLASLLLAGAPQAAEPSPGELVDPVVPVAAPDQDYAVYLPSSYTAERSWPVLFVLDARGRGALAVERFVEGAEEHGWIVLGSNHSASDTVGADPNPAAMTAMLNDVERRFAPDVRRTYVAGFSGTARIAWGFGLQMPDYVTGVFAASGAYPGSRPPTADLPFAVFGTTGTTDFNYQEMRRMGRRLDAVGVPWRVAVFEGPHAWPPPVVAGEAVAWFEVQAMRSGLRERDPALLERLHGAWLQRARSLEAQGEVVAAWQRYREVARDFEGLLDIAEAEAAAARLGSSEAVEAWQRQRDEIATWEQARRVEVFRLAEELGAAHNTQRLQAQSDARRLIGSLQRRVKRGEPAEAAAARRVLALLHAYLRFYLPRDLLAAEAWGAARVPLDLATRIDDSRPRTWYLLAVAEARSGSVRRALRRLEQAVEAGFDDSDRLASDEAFAELRDLERFQAILASLRGGDE